MNDPVKKTNFILNIINDDIANNRNDGRVVTRFPPEPNGYLHIGHAKSICLNFGIAKYYQRGPCHLRFDDTNPTNESEEFMEAIKNDIHWLGFDWGEHLYCAAKYFNQFYDLAVKLIKDSKAYVCSLSADEVRQYRGTLKTHGKNSPYRNRSIAENLELFEKMKNGDFDEGAHTLRAKIDMTSGNINMRDPAIYRIKKTTHHNTHETWNIYPMYDFAHPISDALEGITHSICTLEFQDHRPLYDWFIENCEMEYKPHQYEFSRLNFNYTVTSKKKLKMLVEAGHVNSWDDPRMPTITGVRRRGYTPAAIRNFCEMNGVSKQDSIIDIKLLEECVRDDLNQHAPRRMAVLDPIKVIIDNYPNDKEEILNVANHPQNEDLGRRDIVFAKELYIDRDDFMEEPPKGFRRLRPEGRARLLYGYVIECTKIIKDNNGKVTTLHCNYLPETLGGQKPADGKKVKGIIHWVNSKTCCDATIRIYDRLFSVEDPTKFDDITEALNPNSLKIIKNAKIEPSLINAAPEDRFQFNRVGYFVADRYDHTQDAPVFNLIVSLRSGY